VEEILGDERIEVRQIMYNEWDIFIRELGGGIWFWTSLWLTIGLIGYIYYRRDSMDDERIRVAVSVAIALVAFTAGSAMRAFLTWMQFYYAGNHWDTSPWIKTWPWFGTSVLLNITGGAIAIWLLTPERWRAWLTALAVTTALTVPVALRYLA
jgi:hypothetical protein